MTPLPHSLSAPNPFVGSALVSTQVCDTAGCLAFHTAGIVGWAVKGAAKTSKRGSRGGRGPRCVPERVRRPAKTSEKRAQAQGQAKVVAEPRRFSSRRPHPRSRIRRGAWMRRRRLADPALLCQVGMCYRPIFPSSPRAIATSRCATKARTAVMSRAAAPCGCGRSCNTSSSPPSALRL